MSKPIKSQQNGLSILQSEYEQAKEVEHEAYQALAEATAYYRESRRNVEDLKVTLQRATEDLIHPVA